MEIKWEQLLFTVVHLLLYMVLYFTTQAGE